MDVSHTTFIDIEYYSVYTQSELQVFALHMLSNQAGYRFGIGRIR